MTITIKCPDVYIADGKYVSLFLAGGITNCPDWQEYATQFLQGPENLALVNPRRDDFDVTDPSMSARQIEWEHNHLSKVRAVLFWFPAETLCPITLYELGRCGADWTKKLFVGTDPNYQRRFDVIHQLSLVRPDVFVYDGLDPMLRSVLGWVNNER